MNEIRFSGRAAFSYVWNKNEKGRTLPRLFSAIGAGIIGCTFGYKVKIADVEELLVKHDGENLYFKKEFNKKTKIGDRNIKGTVIESKPEPEPEPKSKPSGQDVKTAQKRDAKTEEQLRSRYETDPHSGTFEGPKSKNKSKTVTYTTADVDNKDAKVVEINVKDEFKTLIKYDYVETDSNKTAYEKLNVALDLPIGNDKESSKWYDKVAEKVCRKYNANASENSGNLPEFIFIEGDANLQHKHVEKSAAKNDNVVVLNASQINYQEQVDNNHNIKKNMKSVYTDSTFGPATVRTEKGGVEFLAHTLIKSNEVEFSGAFCDFFNSARTDDKLHAKGGYYSSKLEDDEWYKLSDDFVNSDTKAEGFCWGTVTMKKKNIKMGGKIIYQTGAMNASGERVNGQYNGMYKELHQKASPPSELQFSILFLQMRNALMYETNMKDSIVVHTTSIGGGCFGNKKNLSMIALQAAILSLPPENRGKIKNVYFGSFQENDAFSTFNNGKNKLIHLKQ